MTKKQNQYIKYKVERNILKQLDRKSIRDFAITSKIYNDLTSMFNICFDEENSPRPKGKTPEEELIRINFQSHLINLSCIIFESYKFLNGIYSDYKSVFIKHKISKKKTIPFKDIRNIIGNHYGDDDFYIELYQGIYTHYYINSGKNFVFYFSKDSFGSVFPATKEIIITMLYIIDHNTNWKAEYQKDKLNYIIAKVKDVTTDSKKFEEWFTKYLITIEESTTDILNQCSIILSTLVSQKK